MKVVSGIIIGLDTDTLGTGDRILDFIRLSQIPMLTINLLHALPRTPLWRRLEAEGRLNFDETRESNVEFLMPYDEVVAVWRRCIAAAYDPDFLYQRFVYNMAHTFCNRIKRPLTPARLSKKNIRKGLWMIANLILRLGIFSNYRKTFWAMAAPKLKTGKIEHLIHIGLVSRHLITFAQECDRGEQAASFYVQNVKAAQRWRVGSFAR